MRVPNLAGLAGYEHGTPGILMIPGVVAQTMVGLGWTKASIREFLWKHSRFPRSISAAPAATRGSKSTRAR